MAKPTRSASLHVALLRGINVGGRNMIAMAKLREMLADLGFTGVRTLLQSGNVVFDGSRRADAELERLLETETAARLGVSANYMVRSAGEWARIVARNPFEDMAKNDPSHLVVMCLKSAADAKKVTALQTAIEGPERIHGDGKKLYIAYPAGIGRSKLTGTLIERKLGTRGTARNWNTVLKLLDWTKE